MYRTAILLALAGLFLPSVCAARLGVAVSIPPQKYFVERIGGDLVDVQVLLPPGASPHSYEPKPRQLAELADADLYFSIGVPMETTLLGRIAAAYPGMTIVAMDKGIAKMSMEEHGHGEHGHAEHDHAEHGHEEHGHAEHEHGHEEHGHGGHHEVEGGVPDPHVWLAPSLVREMAATITEALADADPNNAAAYRQNKARFLEEIGEVDGAIRALLDGIPPESRVFMVFHPSWGYFAREYGLTQVAVETQGREPGPRTLAELARTAESEKIRVVFVQPQFSQKSARALAEMIGGRVAFLDPLREEWDTGLLDAAEAISSAMEPEGR